MATLRIPEVVPSPAEDCKNLKKAFQGFGTDEKAVIRILGRRNASQRRKIRETYQQLYNKSLIDDLCSELSGDFRNAVILWTYDPPERDARLANEALKPKRKSIIQLQVIVEIACATPPHHLVAVRKAYCSLFDRSLEEDIVSNVSPPIQKILVSLVSSYRYDKEVVDSATANMEAATLHEAIGGKKLDDDRLVGILSTRNMFQLRETFQRYKDIYGKSIDQVLGFFLQMIDNCCPPTFCFDFTLGKSISQDIMACGKGMLESVLKVVIWCIDSPEKHFAEVIRAAIVGLGTDEDSLTRAIVTRAEIDMMKVRGEYFNANKTSLDNAVTGDTSGDYKNFLMTLLGANV